MPSLRHLLAAQVPLLILDAASSRVQVGWFGSDRIDDGRWAMADEEAGTGVFRCVEKLQIDLGRVRAFAFCEGPGSVLGIRTVAMALRAWNVIEARPILTYGSLALVAESMGRDDLTVIADARRDLWHATSRGGQLRRVPAAELSGALVTPDHFRNWTPLPAGIQKVPYDVGALLAQTANLDLFRLTSAPDAFLHEDPVYVTWAPKIHRAPGFK